MDTVELLPASPHGDDRILRLAVATHLARYKGQTIRGYLHGISARSSVPPPTGVHIRNCPPSVSTRSARPRIPDPPSGFAPPIPSSITLTTTVSSCTPTRTDADAAC